MLLLALGTAAMLRYGPLRHNPTLSWSEVLFYFAFPPLLVLMTAVAVVCMGYQGQMFGWAASRGSYLLSALLLLYGGITLALRLQQVWLTGRQLRRSPLMEIQGEQSFLLDTAFPYSAQVGIWRSQLVVSQGLLDLLSPEHLGAVFAHETAHHYHRDSFWFLLLGWLRQMTGWLPNTDSLWEELLLLREVRADQTAITSTDPLLLAEALMLVTQQTLKTPFTPLLESVAVPFHQHQERFLVRINGLLDPTLATVHIHQNQSLGLIILFLLALTPLIFIPLHY